MTSWNLNDGTNNFDIYEPNIVRQLAGLNYAEMSVICNETTKPIMGASATLTYGTTTVFVGYVNELKKVNVGEYTLKLVEIANDLTLYYVHTGTPPSENRVVTVDNDSESPYTLGHYISVILNDTGWTDGSDSIYQNITLNPVSGEIFDDTMFNNMTVYDALVQMIETTCGYYVWFDNSLKQVHYGPKDTLVTGRTNHGDLSANIIDVYTEDSNVNHGVDRIVVVSTVDSTTGAKYEGSYPTSGLPTYPKTLIYQYSEVVSDSQAATIAQQIYNERNATRNRFELVLTPDIITINEGDLITYDSVSYSVVDVTIKDDEVVVGLKYYKESIFDRLGDKITLVSGGALGAIDTTFNCSSQNVANYNNNGVTATWSWNITDIDMIGSTVTITPNITTYKSQSTQNDLDVKNEYLSVVSPTYFTYLQSNTVSISTSGTYYPSSSGVTLSAPSFGEIGTDFVYVSVLLPIIYENTTVYNDINVTLQYSYNGSTWYNCANYITGIDAEKTISGTTVTSTSPLTIGGLAIGYTADASIKLRIYAVKGISYGDMLITSAKFNVSYKARHTHTFQQIGLGSSNTISADQVDDVTDTGSPPTYIDIKINSGSWHTISNNSTSPYNFKSDLITGQNIIYAKANSACNVGLTINYQTYGSSS